MVVRVFKSQSMPLNLLKYCFISPSGAAVSLLAYTSFFFLAGESAVVLTSVFEQLQALNERVHTFAFDIVFIQIRQQLAQTPKLQVQFCFF